MSGPPSEMELLDALRALAANVDGPPTRAQMNEHGRYSSTPYYTRWGRWNDALRAAGLGTNHENDIDDGALLAELRLLADELDRTPRFEDMAEHGAYSPSTYVRRWGGWPEAKAAAGLDPATRTSRRIEERDLLDAIHEVAGELGKPPTRQEMNEFGRYSHRPYYRAFSGWRAALARAGFDPDRTHEPGVSDDDLIDALRTLAADLDRTPTFDEMNDRGRYSIWPYLRRWGSWNDAIRAADLTINKRWGDADGPLQYGPEWPERRRTVLERDGYACRGCGVSDATHRRTHGAGLHVHHIERFRSFADPAVANRPSNLVALCRQCHVEWEAAGGIPDTVSLDG